MTGRVPSPATTESGPDAPLERRLETRLVHMPPARLRWRPWIWLFVLLVAFRFVLGMVFAPLAEKSLSRVLGARVEVGDVSFAPIDAVVTLRHVVVHVPGADADADAKPPLTAGRVRIDVQWLPLLHRSLVVRQLTLEEAHVDLERLRGAGWTLERFQHLDPATELPRGWSFALDRIALRDTQVGASDAGSGDAAALDVTVHDALVSTQRQRASAFGRAPNLHVDAAVAGGRLLIAGTTDLRDDGVAIEALIHLKDAPLDRFATYHPLLVGSSVAGRVSGRLQYQRDPGRRDRLTGRLRGRHMDVHVPSLAEPALAIRRIEAGIDGIDLLQHRVTIGTLTLHGARLAVRPDLVAPVPLLDGLALAPPEPIDRRPGPRPAPRAATWSWTIGHLESPFARLLVAGAGEERSLAASVSGESIGPGAYWSPLRAWIGWDGGAAVFDGTARMRRGFTLEGRVTVKDVDAAAVAHAVGSPLATLVQAGRGSADLNVELAMGDASGSPLDVRGKISVGDLWLADEDPNVFAFGARALDLEVARIVAAKDGGGFWPAEIWFATAAVESPYMRVTRAPEARSADVTTVAARSEPQGAAPAVTLGVDDVHVRDGRLLVVDQLAFPSLALDVATVDGWARALRLPAVDLAEFVLQGNDRRLGAMRLGGARSGGELRAELSAPAVNLVAATPYLQRARLPYAFTGGTGAVVSRLSLAGDRWSADTTLTLLDPTLGGDEAVLERSIGMSPEAAFAALRARHGEVSLQLPLGSPGWAGGRALNDMVASAVQEALVRPRLAPLPDGPIEIGFGPGRTEPGPNAGRQLAAIAELLAARPDVLVELRGTISREDRRWIAEQAVVVEETDDRGALGGLLHAIGFRDQRDRIRDALEARGAGRPGRLDSADEAVLGALVAAVPPITDDRLARLAAARETLVANLLADRHGVIATRIVPAGPTAQENGAVPVVDARFVPVPKVAWW
jgi:hypothetical protein